MRQTSVGAEGLGSLLDEKWKGAMLFLHLLNRMDSSAETSHLGELLPWLNHRKHDAEIAESTAMVTEKDAEIDAMRNAAFGQIQEALVQTKAAQKLASVYEKSLRPQAEATLHSTVIAYENDRTEFLDLLDSQMTVIDLDLAYFQALADFEARLADLELAIGKPVDEVQKPSAEVTR